MTKVSLTLIAFCLAIDSFAETQRIAADSGANVIAVELQVGLNRLADLFPDAPVGTIVYKFDNSARWNAAQKYPFGWSHPERKILPWEGAVMVLPTNSIYNAELIGDPVALPSTDYVILNNSGTQAQIYRGFNLISARLARHLAETRREAANVHLYHKDLNRFFGITFDELSDEWFPAFPQQSGAVWYETFQAPLRDLVNAASVMNPATAVYFNNYAPAYGLDRKFMGLDCQPLTEGNAGLRQPGGGIAVYGELVRFTSKFPGYFDPSADLVRYVPGDSGYQNQIFEGGSGSPLTGLFGIPQIVMSKTPHWPLPIRIPPIVDMSLRPVYLGFRPGTNTELRVSLSGGDVGFLQWQKQNADGEWIDLRDATNMTLRFENMQTSHAGTYRVRAGGNPRCDEFFSNEAKLEVMGPRLLAQPYIKERQLHISVYLPARTATKLQISTDLKNWTDFAAKEPSLGWSVDLDMNGFAQFYRVVEVP